MNATHLGTALSSQHQQPSGVGVPLATTAATGLPAQGIGLPLAAPNPLASPLTGLGSSPMQNAAWAYPGQPQQLAAAQIKMQNPSPKRAYGQVQRIAEDQWRCPDGKTFPRAYLAYRHLKELKEKNPNLLSPYKSPRTSTAERRAMQQRVVASAVYSAGASPMLAEGVDPSLNPDVKRTVVELHASQLDAEKLDGNRSALYSVARTWRLNDPYGMRPKKHPVGEQNGNGFELPAPLPHTAESQATDYRQDQPKEVVDLDKVINAVPDTPTELLLETHKSFAKAIRNWWQTRRVHRISRYRKRRLDLILPSFAIASTGNGQTVEEEV